LQTILQGIQQHLDSRPGFRLPPNAFDATAEDLNVILDMAERFRCTYMFQYFSTSWQLQALIHKANDHIIEAVRPLALTIQVPTACVMYEDNLAFAALIRVMARGIGTTERKVISKKLIVAQARFSGDLLGGGAFGAVYGITLNGTLCATKVRKCFCA
jgi:hypothetical protein